LSTWSRATCDVIALECAGTAASESFEERIFSLLDDFR